MPYAGLVFAEANLDDSTKRLGRDNFDHRYIVRQCQYRINDVQRGVELTLGEPREGYRIEDYCLCLCVATYAAGHSFELGSQYRGLGNAVVVDTERPDASGRCDRE